jgi:ubiquinone/menaquinone biosynthesis C-methylase UbiE
MVENHYALGDIYSRIIFQLEVAGKKTVSLNRKDIAAVDEFHIGGQEITRELARQVMLQPGMRILDVGCGLGGACRLFAEEYGCHATGIDITTEYIDIAKRFSQLTNLHEGTNFVLGSATDLPFADKSFDFVFTQHVQMNIADKKKLYAEIARVLVPGGRFVYYDVFATGDQPIHFPVPWANDESISHLITTSALKDILKNAGLHPTSSTDHTAKSIESFEKMLPIVKQQGLPALGTHLLMGDNAIEKQENVLRNLSEKKIVVESGIAEKIIE